jgi:hypothetical protein
MDGRHLMALAKCLAKDEKEHPVAEMVQASLFSQAALAGAKVASHFTLQVVGHNGGALRPHGSPVAHRMSSPKRALVCQDCLWWMRAHK